MHRWFCCIALMISAQSNATDRYRDVLARSYGAIDDDRFVFLQVGRSYHFGDSELVDRKVVLSTFTRSGFSDRDTFVHTPSLGTTFDYPIDVSPHAAKDGSFYLLSESVFFDPENMVQQHLGPASQFDHNHYFLSKVAADGTIEKSIDLDEIAKPQFAHDHHSGGFVAFQELYERPTGILHIGKKDAGHDQFVLATNYQGLRDFPVTQLYRLTLREGKISQDMSFGVNGKVVIGSISKLKRMQLSGDGRSVFLIATGRKGMSGNQLIVEKLRLDNFERETIVDVKFGTGAVVRGVALNEESQRVFMLRHWLRAYSFGARDKNDIVAKTSQEPRELYFEHGKSALEPNDLGGVDLIGQGVNLRRRQDHIVIVSFDSQLQLKSQATTSQVFNAKAGINNLCSDAFGIWKNF